LLSAPARMRSGVAGFRHMSIFANPPCDDGVVLSNPATTACTLEARKWVLSATILASSMAFIDGTVVNVALPAMQKDLGAGISDVQ